MHTIGKTAERAGRSADTLRYYEKAGLITPDGRTASGYRLYGSEALRRLRFIKQAQQCGFTLAEIGELLKIQRDNKACCGDIRTRALEKKLRLEHKIRMLRTMSCALSGLIAECKDDDRPIDTCPILGALEAVLPMPTEMPA